MNKIILAMSILLFSTMGFSANRSDKVFGLNLAAQEPYPGGLGANLMFNLTDWLRISGGGGYYNDQIGSSLIDVPIGMIAIIVYVITGGSTPVEDSIEFLKGESAPPQSIRSYGGGFELLHPSWKTSPVIGLQWGGFEPQNNVYGLSEFAVHKYYKAGLDHQTDSGFNFQLGAMYAPELRTELQYRGYMHVGFFF